MPPVPPELDAVSSIGGVPVLGILIAIVGSAFLALGAQFQHSGVSQVENSHGTGEKAGLSVSQILRLLGRPWWLLGTVMLGLAILFQLMSLAFAPLIVVQPLGVIALVITSLVNARVAHINIDRKMWRSIALCVGGIGIFVAFAAVYATEHVLGGTQLLIVLGVLGWIVAMLGLVFGIWRKRLGPLFYIIAAGVLYGFVATLAKAVINRIGNSNLDWLTVLCLLAMGIAAVLGAYFVQTAYSVGSPDLVIAGLTVVDPLVAVIIGITVFGEASNVPPWVMVVWVIAAGISVLGVFELARHHPQTHRGTTADLTEVARQLHLSAQGVMNPAPEASADPSPIALDARGPEKPGSGTGVA